MLQMVLRGYNGPKIVFLLVHSLVCYLLMTIDDNDGDDDDDDDDDDDVVVVVVVVVAAAAADDNDSLFLSSDFNDTNFSCRHDGYP